MSKNRRNFIKTLGLSGIASAMPLTALFGANIDGSETQGFVIDADVQETFLIAGRQAPVTIIVDKKKRGVTAFSLCLEDIMTNDRIPVHKHLNEDEIIFIQRGSGIFTLGEQEFPVKEGSTAFVPKGVWHGLKNTGTETLRMMFSFSPAGFEGYFREIGTPKGTPWKGLTPAEFDAIDKKYGIVYKP